MFCGCGRKKKKKKKGEVDLDPPYMPSSIVQPLNTPPISVHGKRFDITEQQQTRTTNQQSPTTAKQQDKLQQVLKKVYGIQEDLSTGN